MINTNLYIVGNAKDVIEAFPSSHKKNDTRKSADGEILVIEVKDILEHQMAAAKYGLRILTQSEASAFVRSESFTGQVGE